MSELENKPENRATKDRRDAFVLEYVKDRNATQAAIRAGYSAKSAQQQGARLLSDALVKQRLDVMVSKDNASRLKDGEGVKNMLIDAAELDLTELVIMGKTGITLKEFKEIPKRLRILITEITNVSGKTGWKINFKVYSKEKAVEQLARIYGIDKGNTTNVQVNVSISSLAEKYLGST